MVVVGASEGETGEEDVIGCLEAGGGCSEDVLWGKVGQGREESDDRADEKDVERSIDGGRDGLYRRWRRDGDGLLSTIPADQTRDEDRSQDGSQSKEKGFESIELQSIIEIVAVGSVILTFCSRVKT